MSFLHPSLCAFCGLRPWRHRRAATWLLLIACFALAEVSHGRVLPGRGLIGGTREAAIEELGKPNSALKRADSESIIFNNGVRVDLEQGVVVFVRGGTYGEIVDAGGRRYNVDEKGVARDEKKEIAAQAAAQVAEAAAKAAALAATAVPDGSVAGLVSGAPLGASVPDADAALVHAAEHPAEALAAGHPGADRLLAGAASDKRSAPGQIEQLIGGVLHLTIILALLAIVLKWMGVPIVKKDVLGVAVLTFAVREFLHSLGGLGGNWELVRIFHVEELVSFVALTYLLFRFRVVPNGLRAMQVAAATKFAAYFLMMGVGLALTFGLATLK